MNKTKKVIILIVEGITDEIVLDPVRKLIDSHQFHVQVVYGDAFTKKWGKNKTAKEIVGYIMKQVKDETKFKNSDIAHIIQLIDTDGVFINNDNFIIDETVVPEESKTYSYDFESKTIRIVSESAKKALLKKWNHKKELVMALKKGTTYSSSKVPFSLYFNSLNLDHVITNSILKKDDKGNEAIKFIESNKDLDSYIEFFRTKSSSESFESSWNEIVVDSDWEHPKSNVTFLIDKIKEIEDNN